jgi:Ca2+-binding RTX toxin-like protein
VTTINHDALRIDTGAAGAASPALAPIGVLGIAQRTEVTFVAANAGDLDALLRGLTGEVHVLDLGQDGLAQIAQVLAGRSGVDAVHIISHGESGAIDLGGLKLDAAGLDAHQSALAAIGASLSPDGDVLLYGCDVGAGTAGQAFIERLADRTGADVAASTNLTGAAEQGGDWTLEIAQGQIETAAVVDPALAAAYHQTLAITSATLSFNNSGNWINPGGASSSSDAIYRVSNNPAYQFKIDGAAQGVTGYAGYVASNLYGGGAQETQVTFSFVTGQVFTPVSFKVAGYQSVQPLVFKGYTAGGTFVASQQFDVSDLAQYTTVNFSGMTNIATLKLTSVGGGGMPSLNMDDFVLSNIGPPKPLVTGVTSSTANGAYNAGDVISLQINFDAPVIVDASGGVPQLNLSLSGQHASYASGSGTSSLTFTYTVQAGDTAADLDYAGTTALSLNGATIIGSNGQAAVLTLTTPGTAGSLGANEALVIDTTAPAAPSAPDLAAASDTGTSGSDDLTNVNTPTFTGTAESGATITLYDTDGTTVLGTGVATGGNWSIQSSTLAGGAHTVTAIATDAAGNISPAGSGLTIAVDRTEPTVAITSDVETLKVGETANVTFTFSEDPGATFTGADIAASGGSLGALSGSGLTRTAVFTPNAGVNGGAASLTVAAGSYTDAAGNAGGAGPTPSISFDTLTPSAPSAPDLDPASDTGASSTDNRTTVRTPTFTGTAEAGSTVTIYDTNGTTVLGTGLATGGNWSITSSTLSGGTHTVTAKAADAAGNLSAAGAGLVVDIDVPAPPPPPSSIVVTGGETADVLAGTVGSDTIAGAGGSDTVSSGAGDDQMFGNAGADFLQGNRGDDLIRGGQGDDTVRGGQGDDIVFGDLGADLMFGDLGADRIEAGDGDDQVFGNADADFLQGNQGHDLIRGGQGGDTVAGGQGDDMVFGDLGADLMFGDLGADRMEGGEGEDILSGGAGADVFIFAPGHGHDRITDFSFTQGDRIQLAPGMTYTFAQVGADVVVDLSGGGQVTLAGVQISSLGTGWIV